MDLKERVTSISPKKPSLPYPPTGFGGLTRRVGRKPIIAAVNGHAHGGGFELALNADLVLASPNADFCLPDVKRGTAALMGALPRLVRTFGLQRANLIALTGYVLPAHEARDWGLVCKVVQGGNEELVREAVAMAKGIAACSPDSVMVSRAGVRQAWENESSGVEEATRVTERKWAEKLMTGENAREGMMAFAQKREPKWKPSKL
jgi:enoyl-CoA hydratase/carnithine racemase